MKILGTEVFYVCFFSVIVQRHLSPQANYGVRLYDQIFVMGLNEITS